MSEATVRAIIVATCARCGLAKFVRSKCRNCGSRQNVAGTTRTLATRQSR